ncbi:hypothetical protein [Nostoc sp.]|uniref:hypothetical protein n=1 Tax=Nostoc sp. TaxID=1180 RepID=UPI002FF91685
MAKIIDYSGNHLSQRLLFSRGMSSTIQVVNSAAALILQAFKDSDFSAKCF